uniref:uncharacterized protein LOC124055006 n=1 Tax=Scatophagus argus TaxID=75038 RepID=UPI001ED7FC0A|nr:uncharacterized protein LOC124055006 [Scatophagus argus]
MMSLRIFFVLLCEICQVPAADKNLDIIQDSKVITAEVGETVTLKCLCQDDSVTFFFWYQQSLGGKPLIVSSRMKYSTKASIFPQYKERFRVEFEENFNNLIISHVQLSDSATYYCGILQLNTVEFGQGAFLHVKSSLSNTHAVVHQPVLETLQLGDPAILSCTSYAEKCVGEQSLYWFRHGAAQPAIVYHSAQWCTNDLESHAKNCTSNLTIKSVNSSDAGMYYCALASCGEIVLGNGTKVEIADFTRLIPLLVHCLSVTLAVSIILLLVLAFTISKLNKQICSVCKGTVSNLTSSDNMSQDADVIHYAALKMSGTSKRHRPEAREESICVYSRVKNRKH